MKEFYGIIVARSLVLALPAGAQDDTSIDDAAARGAWIEDVGGGVWSHWVAGLVGPGGNAVAF